MSSAQKEEKEQGQPFIPYTINIMPVDPVVSIPERIDVMGLLYNNTPQTQSPKTSIQQYLPKTLKKEISDEELDTLYDNFKLLSIEKKNNKNLVSLINNSIMPFEKTSSLTFSSSSSINKKSNPNTSSGSKVKNKEDKPK